ncbi:MAG TPA: hypothetical protein DCW51_09460 [Clostridium sp.]|nr:hypothetical protein [Clostridium sp.]
MRISVTSGNKMLGWKLLIEANKYFNKNRKMGVVYKVFYADEGGFIVSVKKNSIEFDIYKEGNRQTDQIIALIEKVFKNKLVCIRCSKKDCEWINQIEHVEIINL